MNVSTFHQKLDSMLSTLPLGDTTSPRVHSALMLDLKRHQRLLPMARVWKEVLSTSQHASQWKPMVKLVL